MDAKLDELVKAYNEQVRRNMDIFVERNKQYGNAFVYTGAIGCLYEIWGCTMRLFMLCFRAKDWGKSNKKVEDTLRDLANYAVMTLMLIEIDRWEADL